MIQPKDSFRVLAVDLEKETGETVSFGDPESLLGGSGLAAALYAEYGFPAEPANHPGQPLIFAIGPLTAYFPLMTKVVLGFRSPYTQQYAESHAGGRLGLALRFAGYDAVVITGVAKSPSCLILGSRGCTIENVHYLWGKDSISTGKLLRRIHSGNHGHRSIVRIGPAGERQVSYASINVDSYRHFGRLGGGAVMGSKKLKAVIALGDASISLPDGKEFERLYRERYRDMVETPAMKKYHDLGTPENLLVLNGLEALPCRNLQNTRHPSIENISGERFAEQLLLRKTACAGCPVGCIHVGLLREQFSTEHEFLYRQVSYDHEPIFAMGSMLGMSNPSDVLSLIEEAERQGLDVMSTGVCLAWATEASEKGLIGVKETMSPLQFDEAQGYREAIRQLGAGANEFYRLLGQGAASAAEHYGGAEFACVLGQEMAGYATGPGFFVSQAYGFRHSHLDSGGYSLDQKSDSKDTDEAVAFLVKDEQSRIELTCMVACLFARSVYSRQRLQEMLSSVGWKGVADKLEEQAKEVQGLRWKLKFQTGFDPSRITIPARFREIRNWKGPLDESFLDSLCGAYAAAITEMGGLNQSKPPPL